MGPAQAHYWAGAFAVQQGDLSLAQAHFEVCAAAYQGADEQASFGWVFLQRGLLARRHGQATDARSTSRVRVRRCGRRGDQRGLAYALINLGLLMPDAHWPVGTDA